MRVERTCSSKPKVSFGYGIAVDCGASQPNKASFKFAVTSDVTGKVLLSSAQVDNPCLKTVCPEGFKDALSYTDGIARRIGDMFSLFGGRILDGLSGEDKKLSGVVIYAPGATVDNKAPIIPNFKIKDSSVPLTNVDYKTTEDALFKEILPRKGIKLAKRVKLFATNDMVGAGAAVVEQLVKHPSFQEGYYGCYLMAGGGLGVGCIEHKGDRVEIKSTECGHVLSHGHGSLEKDGASSTALIRNFSETLGLSIDAQQKLIDLGNAKVVLQFVVKTADEAEANALMATGLFKDIVAPTPKGDQAHHLRLSEVPQCAHTVAAKTAINRFVDNVATIAAVKVNEGVNEVIFTGPLTKGIRKDMQYNPELFGSTTLDELLEKAIYNKLDDAGKGMAQLNNFKLVSSIDVKNNTDGGNLILKGKFIGQKIRGNWLSIPIEALQPKKVADGLAAVAKRAEKLV